MRLAMIALVSVAMLGTGCGHYMTSAVLDFYSDTGVCISEFDMGVEGGKGDHDGDVTSRRGYYKKSRAQYDGEHNYVGGNFTMRIDALGLRCRQAMPQVGRPKIVEH